MNRDAAIDLTEAIGAEGLWVAMPICGACYLRPRIKAHFQARQNMDIALRAAHLQILREP